MATPTAGYVYAGERFPGTTTIIGRFKESGGLLQWAFKQGQSGARHLYENADKAADIGTAAHAMVEASINGGDPNACPEYTALDDDGRDKAGNAFRQYQRWATQSRLELLSRYQEVQLVHPGLKYGGTPDAIGRIGEEIVLLDWKTSNAVYSDYLIQLAAYIHLVNDGVRMDTGEPLGIQVSGRAVLCRFAKEFPDFAHHDYGDLSMEWEQFKAFRECYTRDQIIRKRA